MKVKLWRRVFAASMSAAMLLGLTACGGGSDSTESSESSDGIKTFTMFTAMPGSEINDDNDIIGAKLKETWLTGQTDAEAIGTIIAGGEYPDFINGGDAMMSLYDAGVLVPWDDYLEKYPNLKEMYTDEEWDKFRQEDGKIYWANVFQNTYGEDRATTHNDEAFWIQARVLEWAGYPEIKTLDQYFDLLESYADANPTMANGTKNIPYTALCEDWRYFCIENAPQFLDGYPNDGSVIVDTDTMQVVDYNTTPTAKKYFQKLNEEYQKGYVDVEFATQTYDEYIAKLSTGAVLGMCDQWWNFAYNVNDVFKQQGLDEQGCNYVPLGLTIEEGVTVIFNKAGVGVNHVAIEFSVDGNLYCLGSESAPVTMTVNGTDAIAEEDKMDGYWGGIVAGETCEEMVIDHTIIEYSGGQVVEGSPAAENGYYTAGDDAYPQITTNNIHGRYVVTNSIIRNGWSDGIYMMGGNGIIAGNTFICNGFDGAEAVNVKAGCKVDVAQNVMFSPNTNGLKLSSSGQSETRLQALIQAYNNTIINAGWRRDGEKGGCIYVEQNARVSVFNNLMVNCKFRAITPDLDQPASPDDGKYDDVNSMIDYNFYASEMLKAP